MTRSDTTIRLWWLLIYVVLIVLTLSFSKCKSYKQPKHQKNKLETADLHQNQI